ncbi:MAG: hypothetical protein GX146_08850 [Myxococcales bacterium]|jgi:hypothetical protein|nr:hypothetical protein [Myxococcales bacterium]
MFEKKLHLHSMMVHAIVAFGPLAALAFLLKGYDVVLGGGIEISGQAFAILEKVAIIMMFLISLLAVFTGLSDRNDVYGKWHSTHHIKLWSSLLLIGALGFEMVHWFCADPNATAMFSLYGGLVVIANNVLIALLSIFGLKITLGRQSLAGTSYVPDLFNKEARRDILDEVRVNVREEAKVVDFE